MKKYGYEDFMEMKEGEAEFKKKDGSIRKMKYTMNYEKIPRDKWPKSVTVYDLEKGDYRTIKIESVIGMNR